MVWVGGEKGMEAELLRHSLTSKTGNVDFITIPAAGVHGVGLRALPNNIGKLVRGYFASRKILKETKPDVILFTGGYLAVPMALAGRRIPSLSYVPDIEPGLALKALARFSSQIALTAEESKPFFSANARLEVTGYPVRSGLKEWTKERSLEKLGLRSDLPILLVTGGSKGARSINLALLNALPALLQDCQVIHLCGELDWEKVQSVQASLPADIGTRYHAYPYLHEMGAALAAADLVVSRAGASILGEYPLFGLPAILIPYPFAWRYQKVNADYLVQHGAAVKIEDASLEHQLETTIKNLFEDKKRLENMKASMLALSKPQAAHDLALLLEKLAVNSGRRK
jgi:UDP-N-acetylglucosamine--N-acetylmuramyl-(pentapeptide) pyrophosphoryl-undecaprenol N-acetylglucosamine transferase